MPEENVDINVQIRRLSHNIVTDGFGVMIFALWGFFKVALALMYDGIDMSFMEDVEVDIDREALEIVGKVIFVALFASLNLLQLYLGRCAVKYGRGLRKKWGFLVLAILYAVVIFMEIPSYFRDPEAYSQVDASIAAVMIDVTIVLILFDMVYSAIRLRLIKKKRGLG